MYFGEYVPTDGELREVVRHRIQENMDVNEPYYFDDGGTDHMTPLHYAVGRSHLNLVKLLIEHGADVNRKCVEYAGPLFFAQCSRKKKTYDIYKLLLEKGANCNELDGRGTTPLHHALRNQSLDIIKLLINYGADIGAIDKSGGTALHHVATNPHVDVVQFVLDHGFDVECRDNVGASPLHSAALEGSSEVCELLLSRGARVNATNTTGNTPLITAIKRDDSNEVQELLYGRRNVQAQIVEVLLKYGATLDVGHKNVLELAARRKSCGMATRNCLARHVARMQCLNLNISEDGQQLLEEEDCYRTFYRQCLQELQLMKETNFYNNVSIFMILMGSDKIISGLARNEELVQSIAEPYYDNVFPIYFTWLKRRFYAQVQTQRLRKLAATSLSNIFNLNDPCHSVTQKILSYMRNEDLEFMKIM